MHLIVAQPKTCLRHSPEPHSAIGAAGGKGAAIGRKGNAVFTVCFHPSLTLTWGFFSLNR